MTWLDTAHQAIHENETGMASSTRIAVLLASLTLSFSTVVLTIAVLWMPELTPALSVACGALGGMSGLAYTAGRAWGGGRTRNYSGGAGVNE